MPQRLEDEKQEPLLYDPENPERSCLLDEIPSPPKFDVEGQLMETRRRAAVKAALALRAHPFTLPAINPAM